VHEWHLVAAEGEVMPCAAKPPPDLPCILVDDREKAPLIFSSHVTTERVHLTVADYSMRGHSERIAVERKRGAELCSCMGTGRERFLQQIENLRQYEVRALVIEANLSDFLTNRFESFINPLSILGTLQGFAYPKDASVPAVPVWFCGGPRGAAVFVERMMIREWNRLQEKAKAKMKESA
jgi:ERCC4-type nuclease